MSEQLRERGTFFAVVLYPEEDYKHQQFLQYVLMRPQYDVAYIEHLPEGEEKKKHVHCMIHTKDRLTVGSFVKYFSPWINYAECIHNPTGYLSYMLHDTPSSIDDGKTPYSLSDFRGDRKLWRCLEQNSNFVQLEEVFEFYKDFDTPIDVLRTINHDMNDIDRADRLSEFCTSNYYMFSNAIDQKNKQLERKIKYAKEIFFQ